MKKNIKKTGLRTAGKVFAIIDIVLACLLILGTIAMFVCSSIIAQKIAPYPASSVTEWQALADTLFTWGIVAAVTSPIMLGLSIAGLKLIQRTNNFVAILIIGIANVAIGGTIVLGILMICIATIECYPIYKQNK